jgi:hypothetical protein
MAREVRDLEVVNRIRLGQAQLVADVRKTLPRAESGPTLVLQEDGAVRTSKGVEIRPAPASPAK